MTTKLLANQLKGILQDPVEGFTVELADEASLYEWKVYIEGPKDTPYDGGVFQLSLNFPKDYPMSPPVLKFTSDFYHPNVYPDGKVCMSILHPPGEDAMSGELAQERWLPTQSVTTIVLSLLSLLNDPNCSSPANVDASVEWRKNRESYVNKCKKLVERANREKPSHVVIPHPDTNEEEHKKIVQKWKEMNKDLDAEDFYDHQEEEEEEEEENEDNSENENEEESEDEGDNELLESNSDMNEEDGLEGAEKKETKLKSKEPEPVVIAAAVSPSPAPSSLSPSLSSQIPSSSPSSSSSSSSPPSVSPSAPSSDISTATSSSQPTNSNSPKVAAVVDENRNNNNVIDNNNNNDIVREISEEPIPNSGNGVSVSNSNLNNNNNNNNNINNNNNAGSSSNLNDANNNTNNASSNSKNKKKKGKGKKKCIIM